MTFEEAIEQFNARLSVLEKQRNDALNQAMNAIAELTIMASRLERLEAELASKLNTSVEETGRKTARSTKRKTDG